MSHELRRTVRFSGEVVIKYDVFGEMTVMWLDEFDGPKPLRRLIEDEVVAGGVMDEYAAEHAPDEAERRRAATP